MKTYKVLPMIKTSLGLIVAVAVLSPIVVAGKALAQDSAPGGAVTGIGFSCSVQADVSRVLCKAEGERSFEKTQQFSLEDPNRLVIDILGFQVAAAENYSLADSPVIQRIRSGQRGETARVVLDLKRPVTVSKFLSEDKKTLSFDLSSVESAPPSPPTTNVVDTAAPEPTAAAEPDEPSVREEPELANISQPAGGEPRLPKPEVSIPRKSIIPENVLKFSVSSTFLSFEPGDRPIRDVQVTNKTDSELYLRTDVQRVYDSGTPQERYENTKKMVATPKRFSLPPLATRAVRLVVSGDAPDAGEEIYRLILSPEPLPDAEEVTGEINKQKAVFKVVAALGVTVALPSADAKGVVRIESQVNQAVLINSGTRAVVVEGCSSCPLDKDVCTSSGRKLLYPNRPWSIPVTASGVINCDLSVGKQKQKLSSFYGAKEPQ
jgi:hypothetical protein